MHCQSWQKSIQRGTNATHFVHFHHSFPFISHALFREHCEEVPTGFVKDLIRLGRNIHEVILLDVTLKQNSPLSYSLQPNNGLPIPSFFGDDNDKELSRIFPLLRRLSDADDIFPILQAYREMKATQAYLRNTDPSRSTTKAEMSVSCN